MLSKPPESKIDFSEKLCIVTESIHADEFVGEMLEHLELEIPEVEVEVTENRKLIPM